MVCGAPAIGNQAPAAAPGGDTTEDDDFDRTDNDDFQAQGQRRDAEYALSESKNLIDEIKSQKVSKSRVRRYNNQINVAIGRIQNELPTSGNLRRQLTRDLNTLKGYKRYAQ